MRVDGSASCRLLSNQHLRDWKTGRGSMWELQGGVAEKGRAREGRGGGVGVRKVRTVGLSGSPLFSPHSEQLNGSLFIPAAARWPTI